MKFIKHLLLALALLVQIPAAISGSAQQALASYGAVANTYATMNSGDCDAGITLSNGNLTAISLAGSGNGCRGNIGKSSGKHYFEFSQGTANKFTMIGVMNGSDTRTFTSTSVTAYYTTGALYQGGGAYGAAWHLTSDVIGVAVDLDGGTVEFYKNNTSQGVARTGLSGTYYPTIFFANDANDGGTINLGATAFTYTPPTGYRSGWYN